MNQKKCRRPRKRRPTQQKKRQSLWITRNKIDKEKLYECFKLADIDKKINSLPLKENSLLVKDCYDEAIDLSGGETQRLMLARALYKNSPILILDEPTAALDPIAESRMYEQYNNLAQGKTSIYISHRLASTRFCDRIIFISNNKIAESGTHQELLNLGKEYANLYNIQSKYYKENIEEAM
ncbi:MAG: ATP-binding cassette domain-containing protein [Christensenellaceae bacterium]